jgi:O-antigen ligase
VFPDYIVDPTIGIHPDRARGPFVEAGANGLALFGCGVAATLFAATTADRRIRLAAGAIAIGCAFCIIITLTRSVWIASSVALVVAMLAAPETRRLLLPVVAATALGIVVALALVPGLSEDVDFRSDDDRPVWDRQNANAAALRMVAERPLLGFGWNKFQTESDEYQRLADDHILTRSGLEEHNVFLSNAVELGLIGALLWAAALFIAIGVAAFRRGPPDLKWWQVGLIAIAIQWLIVANFVPLGYAFPTALLWLWAGAAWVRPAGREPAV